jgi:hypothetical protein
MPFNCTEHTRNVASTVRVIVYDKLKKMLKIQVVAAVL